MGRGPRWDWGVQRSARGRCGPRGPGCPQVLATPGRAERPQDRSQLPLADLQFPGMASGLPSIVRSRPPGTALLLALPILVLIVPQGTVERSLVPESAFVLLLLLTVTLVLAQSGFRSPSYSIRADYANPLMLLTLTYFLLLNPAWSFLSGNDFVKITMTAIPFVLLGTHYLIAALWFDIPRTRVLVAMLAVSGVI